MKGLLSELGIVVASLIGLAVLLTALAFACWLIYLLATAIFAISLKTLVVTVGAVCFSLVIAFGLFGYWQLHQK